MSALGLEVVPLRCSTEATRASASEVRASRLFDSRPALCQHALGLQDTFALSLELDLQSIALECHAVERRAQLGNRRSVGDDG